MINTTITCFILQRHDGLYFARPYGPDNREWTDQPGQAHRWTDVAAAAAAAKVWQHIKGEELTVLQMAEGPNFRQVVLPGQATFGSVTHAL